MSILTQWIRARLMIQMLQFCSFCCRNQMATAQKVFLFFPVENDIYKRPWFCSHYRLVSLSLNSDCVTVAVQIRSSGRCVFVFVCTCVCQLVSLCTHRRTRRCLCRHCLWLRGGWEHKSELIQRLNCRLTQAGLCSHMSQVTVLTGGASMCSSLRQEAVWGCASTFTICGLVTAATSWPSETEWNCPKKWMVRIKRLFFLFLLCSFDRVEMSAWKGWRLNSLSVKVQEPLQLKNSQLNLTGSSMTPWRSTLASASSYI